jgi:hypothetical protein
MVRVTSATERPKPVDGGDDDDVVRPGVVEHRGEPGAAGAGRPGQPVGEHPLRVHAGGAEHAELGVEDLLELLTDERLDLGPDDPRRPILLAVSDNGPPMTAHTNACVHGVDGHCPAPWPPRRTSA